MQVPANDNEMNKSLTNFEPACSFLKGIPMRGNI